MNNFFLFDEGSDEKIIIFGTFNAKELIKKTNVYYGDGTFKVTPKPFYQVYTIHADISHSTDTITFVPLIYALLPNKTKTTYKRLFMILKTQFQMNLKVYRCDYEIAVIHAVQEVFANVSIKGCYYHFMNAIWRMSKKINFNKTKEGKHITRLSTLLALLPKNLIPEAYLYICDIAPKTDIFDKFIQYFDDQWIKNITSDIFSCYGEKNRTTNAIEGWHRRLNTKIPQKPTLLQFISLLKKEAHVYEVKMDQNKFHCQEQKRRQKLILKDEKINKIIMDAVNNLISVEECLGRLNAIITNANV